MFGGRIEARPEALAGFLRDAEAIAADLRDRPIGADEMQRARRPLVEAIQRQRARQRLVARQSRRASRPTRGRRDDREPARRLSAMTPAELQAAARAFLVPGRAWKVVVVPAAPPAPTGPPGT